MSESSSELDAVRRVWETFEAPPGLVAQYYGGRIVMQAAPKHSHRHIQRDVVRQTWDSVEAWMAAAVDCGVDGEPQPDLMWVRAGDTPPGEQDIWAPQTVLAVAEVLSPSTAKHDRGEKADIYARVGIRAYVIVDPATGRWERFGLTPEHRYALVEEGDFGRAIRLPAGDAGTVVVDTTAWSSYPN